MRLEARFRRWCHLMWHLAHLSVPAHRAVTGYQTKWANGVNTHSVVIACTCGEEWT